MLFEDIERGWHGEPSGDGGLHLWRVLRGVREEIHIDGPLIASADARRLDKMTKELQATYLGPAQLNHKDKSIRILSPTDLLKAVLEIGQQGFSLQRYKGLGEMNPDQLWQTTLDNNARSLLQVKISDVAETNNLFEQLMGDVVEHVGNLFRIMHFVSDKSRYLVLSYLNDCRDFFGNIFGAVAMCKMLPVIIIWPHQKDN